MPNSRKKWWLCLGIIKKRKWIDGSKDDLSHKCYYSNLQAASNLTCFRCWPTNFAGGPHHSTHCSKNEYYYKYCTSPTIFYKVCLERNSILNNSQIITYLDFYIVQHLFEFCIMLILRQRICKMVRLLQNVRQYEWLIFAP